MTMCIPRPEDAARFIRIGGTTTLNFISWEYRQAPGGYGDAPLREVLTSRIVERGEHSKVPIAELLDILYAHFNRDERPDGAERRAMSVGDLVTIDDGASRRNFVCAPAGWVLVSWADGDANARSLETRKLLDWHRLDAIADAAQAKLDAHWDDSPRSITGGT